MKKPFDFDNYNPFDMPETTTNEILDKIYIMADYAEAIGGDINYDASTEGEEIKRLVLLLKMQQGNKFPYTHYLATDGPFPPALNKDDLFGADFNKKVNPSIDFTFDITRSAALKYPSKSEYTEVTSKLYGWNSPDDKIIFIYEPRP